MTDDVFMARPPKHPLRSLSEDEKQTLLAVSRSFSEPAAHVARAKILLAVQKGASFINAAQMAGRKSGEAVARLVKRFNESGLAALEGRYQRCGKKPTYTQKERQRILLEFERTPDREVDRCATWSLSLLRDALRKAPDGLPCVSTYTIWKVLHQAGYTCQRDRTWCKTGKALRMRHRMAAWVKDPDTDAKKN